MLLNRMFGDLIIGFFVDELIAKLLKYAFCSSVCYAISCNFVIRKTHINEKQIFFIITQQKKSSMLSSKTDFEINKSLC